MNSLIFWGGLAAFMVGMWASLIEKSETSARGFVSLGYILWLSAVWATLTS